MLPLTLLTFREDLLVGHSLENDLKALRVCHSNVLDTAIMFPHKRGLPYKNSLRWLANVFLKRQIQVCCGMRCVGLTRGQTADSGHDSREDAIAALDLAKLKVSVLNSRITCSLSRG